MLLEEDIVMKYNKTGDVVEVAWVLLQTKAQIWFYEMIKMGLGFG